MSAEAISRRLLLGAATAALLGGCTDGSSTTSATSASAAPAAATGGSPNSARSGEVSTDLRLVERAVASGRRLVADYAGLVTAHPDVRRTTAPLRDHLVEQLTALGEDVTATKPNSAARSRQQALRTIATAERSASRARLEDAGEAASGDVARILASIAASHAQHALVLEGLPR